MPSVFPVVDAPRFLGERRFYSMLANFSRRAARRICIAILCTYYIGIGTLAAQDDFSTGLLEDDAAFEQNVEMTAEFSNDGRRAGDLPRFVSLRQHTPFPQHQGNINSCIGWAMGYGALTTQKACLEGRTDRVEITRNAYSALYIYNQVKEGNCLGGAYVHTAAAFLQKNGDCQSKEFDNPPTDCLKEPAEALKNASQEHAIKDYVALFNRKTDPKTSVMRTKRSLAEGKPVVVGIRIKESLKKLKKSNPVWKPTDSPADAILGGHAVCVVGYNDSLALFEIMNSWGDIWADGGFFYMSYKDFSQYTFQGLQLILPEEELTADQEKTIADLKLEAEQSKNAGRTPANQASNGKPAKPRRPNAPREVNATEERNSNPVPATAEVSGDPSAPQANDAQVSARTTKKPQNTVPPTPALTEEVPVEETQAPAATQPTKTKASKIAPAAASNAPATAKKTTTAPAKSNSPANTGSENADEAPALLGGEFLVRLSLTDEFGTPIMENGEYQFEELEPLRGEGYYELTKQDWQVGDLFQVVARNIKKDSYVYMFSLDGNNKAEIHWPRNQRFPEHLHGEESKGKGEGALVGHSGAEIVIPGNDRALTRENRLTDHICMLNSSKRIDDFQKRVIALRDDRTGEFAERFQRAFGDIALPAAEVNYAENSISGKASNLANGTAIPLIVKIENR